MKLVRYIKSLSVGINDSSSVSARDPTILLNVESHSLGTAAAESQLWESQLANVNNQSLNLQMGGPSGVRTPGEQLPFSSEENETNQYPTSASSNLNDSRSQNHGQSKVREKVYCIDVLAP